MKKLVVTTIFIISAIFNPVMSESNDYNQLAEETIRELIIKTEKDIHIIEGQIHVLSKMKESIELAMKDKKKKANLSLTIGVGGTVTMTVAGVLSYFKVLKHLRTQPFTAEYYLKLTKTLGFLGFCFAATGGLSWGINNAQLNIFHEEVTNLIEKLDDLEEELERREEKLSELFNLLESE